MRPALSQSQAILRSPEVSSSSSSAVSKDKENEKEREREGRQGRALVYPAQRPRPSVLTSIHRLDIFDIAHALSLSQCSAVGIRVRVRVLEKQDEIASSQRRTKMHYSLQPNRLVINTSTFSSIRFTILRCNE